MRTITALLITAGLACAVNQQVRLTSGPGTATTPATSAFNGISPRWELRYTSYATPSADCTLTMGDVNFRLNGSGQFYTFGFGTAHWSGVSDNGPQATIGSATDFLIRVQPNPTSKTVDVEKWAVDGSGYTLQQRTTFTAVASTDWRSQAITIAGCSGTGSTNLTFFRFYGAQVALGSTPPYGDHSAATGALIDYEFDGNGNDSSGNAVNLAGLGAGTYTTAPTYAPACIVPARSTFKVGTPKTVTFLSFPLDRTASLTSVAITQAANSIGYPAQSTSGWTGLTTQSPSITASAFGPVNLAETAQQPDGRSSSCTVRLGAVVTDSQEIVQYPSAYLNWLLGPQMRNGTSSSSYVDYTQLALADFFGGLQAADPDYVPWWRTPEAGTVSISTGAPLTVTGVGTSFQSTVCTGGTTPREAANITMTYPLSGGRIGHAIRRVASCPSNTQITLAGGQEWAYPFNITAGNYTYSYDSGPDHKQAPWAGGGTNANYYDNVIGFVSAFYASGIEDYLTWAVNLAEMWWEQPFIDQGRTCQDWSICIAPRIKGITGLYWLATHQDEVAGTPGASLMWDGLRLWEQRMYDLYATNYIDDVREEAVKVGHSALTAALDPDAATRLLARGHLQTYINTKWGPQQRPNKEWAAAQFSYASWQYGGTASVTNGSNSVVLSGVTLNCTSAWPDGFTETVGTPAEVTISNSNPAIITHHHDGNINGFQYYFEGGTGLWAGLNGVHVVTKIDDTHFSIPVDSTGFGSPAGQVIHLKNTLFWATGSSADWGQLGGADSVQYWITGCNSGTSTVTLLTNYAGTTSATKGWMLAESGGMNAQPFLEAFVGRVMVYSYEALRGIDDTTANKAKQYVVDLAGWLKDYGYRAASKGLWYSRDALRCESPFDPLDWMWCRGGETGDVFRDDASRYLASETVYTFSKAYEYSADATMKTFVDGLYAAMYARDGYTSPVAGDGTTICSYVGAECASFDLATHKAKTFGLTFGWGGGSTWPAARLGASVASTAATVIGGAVTMRSVVIQ